MSSIVYYHFDTWIIRRLLLLIHHFSRLAIILVGIIFSNDWDWLSRLVINVILAVISFSNDCDWLSVLIALWLVILITWIYTTIIIFCLRWKWSSTWFRCGVGLLSWIITLLSLVRGLSRLNWWLRIILNYWWFITLILIFSYYFTRFCKWLLTIISFLSFYNLSWFCFIW